MSLEFTKRAIQPGLIALEIRGNIHCGPECARLEREVDGMIAAHETCVILDMAGVTHVDSAAIGAIVRCLTKLKSAGGGLRIAAVEPMIDYSLKLTKVDKVVEIFPQSIRQRKDFLCPSQASVGNPDKHLPEPQLTIRRQTGKAPLRRNELGGKTR